MFKTMRKNINLIVACQSKDFGIAQLGKIPWRSPSDLRHFKNITSQTSSPNLHNAVVMGRKTYDSIGKVLPNRVNYVITRNKDLLNKSTANLKYVTNLREAFNNSSEDPNIDKIFVIGGEEIYTQTMESWANYLDTAYITFVHSNYACDRFLPKDLFDLNFNWTGGSEQITDGDVTINIEEYRGRNRGEEEYLNLLKRIMETGERKTNRTGIDTVSVFGERMVFDISERIPFLTTKRLAWKTMLRELLWFIQGNTNNADLQAKRVHIWDGNSTREYLDSIGLTERVEGDIGPCFPADTPVLTNNGYKNIQDITNDDLLYTHNGNWKSQVPMTNIFTGQLITIKAAYHFPITGTDEHPFYARTFKKIDVRKPKHHYEIVCDEPEWIPLKDITKNHLLGFKIETEEKIPVLQLTKYKNQHISREIYNKTLDSEDLWYLMGYFLGDGWLVDEKACSRIYFVINHKERDEVLPNLQKVLNLKLCEPLQGCDKYKCTNQEVSQILKQFGKYAHGKKIPDWVHKAPKNLIKQFLNGYCMADGYYVENRSTNNDSIRYTTVSRDIALSLQRLYLKLGMIASISYQKRGYKKYIYDKLVNQRDAYFIEVYENKKRRCNWSFIENDYVWFSIKQISSKKVENLTVYNFTVDDDNTYTVSNLSVHNCYGFQWRHFGAEYVDCHTDYTGQGVDQLADVVNQIKNNPQSRRIVMSAWNPQAQPLMALPPCHLLAQWYVRDGVFLDCQMYQRSCDIALGVPFNIASYSVLTYMIAHVCGLQPGRYIQVMGDAHIYVNHLDGVKEQLKRVPYPFPQLTFAREINDIDDFREEDFVIKDYRYHPTIKMDMAV